jgi:DNA polymerase I
VAGLPIRAAVRGKADAGASHGVGHGRQTSGRRPRSTRAAVIGLAAMSFGKGCHLHLIDGSSFIFRAYHALPPLTRKSDGLPIGAVAGFCNMLFKYVEGNNGAEAPTHAAVIFDYSSKTFRNEIYPDYKANRPEPPEDLRPQFPLTRDATRAFNIACIEVEDYEADDIIATLACQARKAGGTVTIISSDKDLMQLVGNGVEMLDAMKDRRIGPEEVEAKFGVGPDRVIDVQALAGDSTDNIPGAPGIGVKTAALLINEFGDLETLLARADEIKQPKRRQTLIDFADQVRVSRRLVTLDCETPLDFALDDLEVKEPDPDVLMEFLAKMEFRTLSRRIAQKMGIEPPAIPDAPPAAGADAPAPEAPAFDAAAYECLRDMAALERWIAAIRARGFVAVDTETTALDEMRADLVGISLAVEPGRACYIPLAHRNGGADLFDEARPVGDQIDRDAALAALKPVLEDDSILKIGQNMKYDAKIFARNGIRVAPIDDTMLISYAQHAGLHGHGMDALSERYLGHQPIPIKPLLGSGKSARTFDLVPIERPRPMPPRMPTSPCGCGRRSSRGCIVPASPPSTRPWSARWFRCWPRWKWPASASIAMRCRACRTPFRRRWPRWRPRFTTWLASVSTSAAPSSWARSCSTR